MILKCECGGNVSSAAAGCPHCGKPGPFQPPTNPKPSIWPQLIVSVVLTLAVLALLLMYVN